VHADGPEREGRRNAARIGDGARGDDRHLHRIDDLRNECERAGLSGDVVAQEDAAMAAGLVALRDHGIDAPRFEPARLGGGGRRTHHQKASRLEPLQEPRLKWKLTTSGFVSSTTSHMTESNAVRLVEGTGAAGSIASSQEYGGKRS